MSVYDDTLRLELARSLAQYEAAGMTEEAEKTKARLAELDGDGDEPDEDGDGDDLASRSKTDLNALAKERGIEGYRQMDKDELIAALEEG